MANMNTQIISRGKVMYQPVHILLFSRSYDKYRHRHAHIYPHMYIYIYNYSMTQTGKNSFFSFLFRVGKKVYKFETNIKNIRIKRYENMDQNKTALVSNSMLLLSRRKNCEPRPAASWRLHCYLLLALCIYWNDIEKIMLREGRYSKFVFLSCYYYYMLMSFIYNKRKKKSAQGEF